MPARTGFAALVVTLAVTAAACSSGGPELDQASATATPRPASPSPTGNAGPEPTDPRGGIPAVLDFEGRLLDGGTLDGATLADKDVAFWFWAPW